MDEEGFGNIIYTQHFHGPLAGQITIDSADPCVLILDEVLHDALEGRGSKFGSVTTVRPAPDTGWCDVGPGVCEYPSHPFCFTGWLVTVDLPTGDRLIYRVGRYRLRDNCWEARWPD